MCLIVFCFVVITLCGWAIVTKSEPYSDPFDVTEIDHLYYRGLGLGDWNNWIGKKRIKLVDSVYPSGKVEGEYQYDRDGYINIGYNFYENGQVESVSPFSGGKDGNLHDDGIWSRFYEDGHLESEEGRRTGRSDSGLVDHGITREYARNGKLVKEEFYLNGQECSKEEWGHWLETHPEDVKYGK